MGNKDNSKIGNGFRDLSIKVLSKYFGKKFFIEETIKIGNPPHNHKFDIVDETNNIVAECKAYTYTATGNIPSAKIMGLDEAIFYFSFLPKNTRKILCMKKAINEKNNETLAEYYKRIKDHLIGDVEIWEIEDENTYKIITSTKKNSKTKTYYNLDIKCKNRGNIGRFSYSKDDAQKIYELGMKHYDFNQNKITNREVLMNEVQKLSNVLGGANCNTIYGYINDIPYLMSGTIYKWILPQLFVEVFFNNILKDYGSKYASNMIEAVKKNEAYLVREKHKGNPSKKLAILLNRLSLKLQ